MATVSYPLPSQRQPGDQMNVWFGFLQGNGQVRDAMSSVFLNPHGFSAGWVCVMIYFVLALGYLCLKIIGETKLAEGKD